MKTGTLLAAVLLIWVTSVQAQGNTQTPSFSTAKKRIAKIYADHRVTLYCGCRYTASKAVQAQSCGFRFRKNKKRASRIEWEHIVPASRFGKTFPAWKSGHPSCVTKKGKKFKGRRCAPKAHKLYKLMEADLWNLVPAVGEVNGDRSNKPMRIIPGEARAYGSCDAEVARNAFEPTEGVRGDIARIYLYMDWAYPGRVNLTPTERDMFEQWSASDPISAWECTRAKRIAATQGNQNPFVTPHCP